MTVRGRLISLFGAFHLTLVSASFLWSFQSESLLVLAVPLFFLYLFPVLCLRLHNWLCPLKGGFFRLDERAYSAWWGTHQIQALFNAIPWLESPLRMIPGVYSLWLRMWGSRIGRGVYWTAQVEITDRSLLEVGDHTIFGHKVACYAHVINEKEAGMVLYVRRIAIGHGVFIGGGSRLGPGVVLEDAVVLPHLSDVSVNQRVRRTG